MKSPRTETEIADTLEEVQLALELVVERLGLAKEVQDAIGARRLKVEHSRLEIERSLGFAVDPPDERG